MKDTYLGLLAGAAVFFLAVNTFLALKAPVPVYIPSGSSPIVMNQGEGEKKFGVGTITFGNDIAFSGALTASSTFIIGDAGAPAINGHYYATSSIDVDNIPTGSVTTSAITVTGASAGDVVHIMGFGFTGSPTTSIILSGYVSAANTVTAVFQNTTNTAVNVSSTTYHANVWSHSAQSGN